MFFDTVLNSDYENYQIWMEKICDADYFEKVFIDLVPTMTGYNSDFLTLIYSTPHIAYPAWCIFNKVIYNVQNGALKETIFMTQAANGYVGAIFNEVQNVYIIKCRSVYTSDVDIQLNSILDVTYDGATWVNIANPTILCPSYAKSESAETILYKGNLKNVKGIRITKNSEYNFTLDELYIYGR